VYSVAPSADQATEVQYGTCACTEPGGDDAGHVRRQRYEPSLHTTLFNLTHTLHIDKQLTVAFFDMTWNSGRSSSTIDLLSRSQILMQDCACTATLNEDRP
jgi:hypothetical protein